MGLCIKLILFIFTIFGITKISLGENIIFDDFSKNNLWQYDQSHIKKCSFNCGSYRAYRFLKESNGNQYIRLTSKVGQLSKFNKGQVYIKDRIELGTKSHKISKNWSDLINKEIWWTFDIKLPEKIKKIHAKKITFTQLKTIEKNSKKKQCHPGMPFRINYNHAHTWIAVTDGFNKKLKRNDIFENILTNYWTNFKIGYYFSKNNGWVKVYKNGKIILNYEGNTIFDNYRNCNPVSDLETYVRIGVYRETSNKKEKNDSLDFDNFLVCVGNEKKCSIQK
tara:strand:- start:590 stop:1426 length:837 start_codon:yes stop_codon:yes gene_type:complete